MALPKKLRTPAKIGGGLLLAGAVIAAGPYVSHAMTGSQSTASMPSDWEVAQAVAAQQSALSAINVKVRVAEEERAEREAIAKKKAAAEAKKKAEARAKARAKARAAEKAKAARAKARAAAISGGTPSQNRALGMSMCADAGFSSSQCADLAKLWERESSWNHRAANSSSGAYGIPQSLPGSKMATAGSDWRTNPRTQIKWGLKYIRDTYGNPSAAWGHSQSYGWY